MNLSPSFSGSIRQQKHECHRRRRRRIPRELKTFFPRSLATELKLGAEGKARKRQRQTDGRTDEAHMAEIFSVRAPSNIGGFLRPRRAPPSCCATAAPSKESIARGGCRRFTASLPPSLPRSLSPRLIIGLLLTDWLLVAVGPFGLVLNR